MSDDQLSLPGMGRRYPAMDEVRALGRERYRRHLVLLACRELAAESYSVSSCRQEAVHDRVMEIHERHHPGQRWVDGVCPRTLRNDAKCRRWMRRLRRLPYGAGALASKEVRQAAPDALIAARDAERARADRAERGRREIENRLAVALAEVARLTGGPMPVEPGD